VGWWAVGCGVLWCASLAVYVVGGRAPRVGVISERLFAHFLALQALLPLPPVLLVVICSVRPVPPLTPPSPFHHHTA